MTTDAQTMRNSILPILLAVLAMATVHGGEPPFGIDSRAENTTLLIDTLPDDNPSGVGLELAFPGLEFQQPVLLVEIPDGSGRLVVVQQDGRLVVFPNDPGAGPGDASDFLDIRGRTLNSGEQGMLGLAFDPDYAANGEFYVYYTFSDGNPGTSRVSRFTNTNPAGNVVDEGTEEVVLAIDQPFGNHNAGMIAFGPFDGMLYIALGDGGGGGDPLDQAQDTTTLLGSILRIDVRSDPAPGETYTVPADNPFVGGGPGGPATRPEIWAYGFRNPFRFSFDILTGELWVGDVGQSDREEINIVVPGGNYGWNIMEGDICYPPGSSCDTAGLEMPVAVYGHDLGRAVTGGVVYYGTRNPSLYGAYVFGDSQSGRMWATTTDGAAYTTRLVLTTPHFISGFGQTSDGEVYVIDYFGDIYWFRAVPGRRSNPLPTRLSGLSALLAAGGGVDQTNAGILPYEPSAQLWSDGALKERYIALPGLDTVGYTQYGSWQFGENAVLVKNFLLPLDDRDPAASAQRIETRVMVRQGNQWNGFTYEWNPEGTDAQLLPAGGKTRAFTRVDKQGEEYGYEWLYPSRTQCIECHTRASGGALGLTTGQINSTFQYPGSGIADNQLRTLAHIGLFEGGLPAAPPDLPRIPDYSDDTEALEDRVRAYLFANCAMCHQPGGGAPAAMDLRWQVATDMANMIYETPLNGNLGIPYAKLIVPHQPAMSVLLGRMESLDENRMPPLSSNLVDEEAVDLVTEWVNTLPAREQGWMAR